MIEIIQKQKKYITLLSSCFILLGFLSGLINDRTFQNLTYMMAAIIAGVPILIKTWQALRMKVLGIDLLVSIAVISAFYIGEYTEASVVTFLFLFGDFLEARTLEKTRSSIKELMDWVPKEAVINRNGSYLTIPVEEVVAGDCVIIRSGGKVSVDGRIISGKALMNEAAITGESIPIIKKEAGKVFSGTIVDQGYIEVIAEQIGEDTTFAKMIELVEEAQESKTNSEKFINKFSEIYTLVIVALAIIALMVTRELHLAITFLVIACPGALVIGPPVSIVAGIGNGAKNGVLLKGGEVIERLAKVDTLVFDKTGTLTKGKPKITDIRTFNNFDSNELLRLVAQAETISEHHLGQTIVNEAKERKLKLGDKPINGEIIKGSGIRANLDSRNLVVGNHKLMMAENIPISNEALSYAMAREKTGNTAVFAAIDGKIAGIISIADQIREDAKQAIEEMKKNGISKFVMLTGDNKSTAELVAGQLEIHEFQAELMPEEKVDYVKERKKMGHVVAMAGDGINDAPAIGAADIGVAMGAGTDVSIETADVVLMGDRLLQLSYAFSLSKATIRNMKQNIFFSISIVMMLLIGILLGDIHLGSGMFIHEASVLLVILNGMRLTHFKQRKLAIKTKMQELAL